jgi:outer membrane protein assembly factor BamB
MSLRRVAALAALAVLMLPACSDPGPKPAELKEFKPLAKARVAWSVTAGPAGNYVFTPAILDGDVFTASTAGEVTRFDVANGKRKWRAELPGKTVLSGGVAAGGGLVLAATAKGAVHAWSPDGKPLWQSQVSSEVLSVPATSDGVVVVRSGDGRIHGLDARDGTRRWEYVATLPPLLIRTTAGVTIEGGSVFAGLPGGKLVALSLASGAVLWEAALSTPRGETELERTTDVTSTPIVEDGKVCAVAFQGRIGCFDAQKGTLVWARNASSVGDLGADDRFFYFVDESSHLHAIDRDSGATLWKQTALSYRSLGAPAATGRFVAVGDFEGYLHFFDREDGNPVARISTDGGQISAQPLVVGEGNLLVQTREGTLYAVTVR